LFASAPKRLDAFFVGFALLERFLACEQYLTDAREAAGGYLSFGEARDFFGDLARIDGAGHGRFSE
jgi:hypothetical protein